MCIHSSVHGHLGCFHHCLFWILLLWTYKFMAFWMLVFIWVVYPRGRITVSYTYYMLKFWGTTHPFSTATVPFKIPTSNCIQTAFHYSTSPTAIVILPFVRFSYPGGYYSYFCAFALHFQMTSDAEHVIMWLSAICVSSLGNSHSDHLPIFIASFCVISLEL